MSHEHFESPEGPASDAVERLLRGAGHRRRPPSGAEAEIRQVVQSAWQAKVAERRAANLRRRRQQGWMLAAAAALLLVVGATLWQTPWQTLWQAPWQQATDPSAAAVVVARVEAWFPAPPGAGPTVGTELTVGATLSTDDGQRLALRLASGASARLDHGSRLTLLGDGSMELERGALYLDSAGTPGLEIHTPWGVARNIGTQFEVRLHDAGMRLGVRQGQVALEVEGTSHEATAGGALSVTGAGVVSSTISSRGTAWDWVLDAAPPFTLEGRTLGETLAWISRETGWEVRWTDPELEAEATPTQLQGALGDLRPDRAHELVLPIAGLSGRLEDGVLWVERFGAQR